jgi:hypothetical protein
MQKNAGDRSPPAFRPTRPETEIVGLALSTDRRAKRMQLRFRTTLFASVRVDEAYQRPRRLNNESPFFGPWEMHS